MALERARFVLAATVVATCMGSAVAAQTGARPQGPILMIAQQTYLDVVGMLENTGYRVLNMKSTFLGRVRIRAMNREHVREVVVSRSTGEIKSDRIIQMIGGTNENGTKRQTGRSASDSVSDGGLNASVGSSSGSVGSSGVSASAGGASVSVGSGGIGIGN